MLNLPCSKFTAPKLPATGSKFGYSQATLPSCLAVYCPARAAYTRTVHAGVKNLNCFHLANDAWAAAAAASRAAERNSNECLQGLALPELSTPAPLAVTRTEACLHWVRIISGRAHRRDKIRLDQFRLTPRPAVAGRLTVAWGECQFSYPERDCPDLAARSLWRIRAPLPPEQSKTVLEFQPARGQTSSLQQPEVVADASGYLYREVHAQVAGGRCRPASARRQV